jgi:hypothetical protein
VGATVAPASLNIALAHGGRRVRLACGGPHPGGELRDPPQSHARRPRSVRERVALEGFPRPGARKCVRFAYRRRCARMAPGSDVSCEGISRRCPPPDVVRVAPGRRGARRGCAPSL